MGGGCGVEKRESVGIVSSETIQKLEKILPKNTGGYPVLMENAGEDSRRDNKVIQQLYYL
jgi:hypothetical protein